LRQALPLQLYHLLVAELAMIAPVRPQAFGARGGLRGRLWRRCGRVRHGVRGLPHSTAVTINCSLHGCAEVLQQMPPIGHLERVGCALACCIGIGAGTVTCDNFDSTMPLQPSRNCAGFSVGQQVDNLVALEVNQDGSVALAAPPRPVIDRQHAWRRRLGRLCAPDQAQHGVGADRHSQQPSQAGAGLAAERQTKAALRAVQARGAARRASRSRCERLGEGLARAGGIAAAEAAHPDQEHGRAPLPRQVVQPALVAGVDAGRAVLAIRTGRGRSPASGDDGDPVGGRYDPLDREAGGDQR
jgi:hypothetical protein